MELHVENIPSSNTITKLNTCKMYAAYNVNNLISLAMPVLTRWT